MDEKLEKLTKAVVALEELVRESKSKTEAEIREIKDRIIKDAEKVRARPIQLADHLGEELPKEFPKKHLMDEMRPMQRLLNMEGPVIRKMEHRDRPVDDLVVEFQKACDEAAFLAKYFESKENHRFKSVVELESKAPYTVAKIRYYANLLAPIFRADDAMDTGTELANWIPTDWSRQMIELVRTEYLVTGLFPEIPMPTPTYPLPIEGTDLTAYLVGEQTKDPTSESATGVKISKSTASKVTFTAKKFGVRCVISDEATEDTIIPVLPYTNRKHVLAHAEATDAAITDGQASGTLDTGLSLGSDDRRKAWDGLRYIAKVTKSNATMDLSTFSFGNLMKLRGKMGKYGQRARDLAILTSWSGLYQLLKLDQVATLEKYGPNATVLTGELAKISNIPIIIVGNTIWEQLNTTGIYDGSTTDYTCLIMVNRTCFGHGVRLGYNYKTLQEVYAPYGAIGVVSFSRHAFEDLFPGASDLDVVYGYKIPVA